MRNKERYWFIHVHACDEGQDSDDVRVPMDYVCEHENAICLSELIYYHVRGYDAHQHVDGNGCAPFRHAYANVYASECMLLSPPVIKG